MQRKTLIAVSIVCAALLLLGAGCCLFGPDELVVDIAVISGVPVPAVGDPMGSAITETDQFTGVISWSPVGDGSFFGTGTVFTATITLTAKSGYTFKGVAQNFFSVAGADSVTNPADSGVVTAVFPRTENPE